MDLALIRGACFALMLFVGTGGCGGGDSGGVDAANARATRICTGSCSSDDECIEDIGGAPMPGIDPTNFRCQAGQCVFRECASDDECTAGGTRPHLRCRTVAGRALCIEPCEPASEECFFGGCFHQDDAGGSFCSYEGCSTDGHCENVGTCDEARGWCVCESTDQCGQYACGE